MKVETLVKERRASIVNVEPKEKRMIGLDYIEASKYLDFLV